MTLHVSMPSKNIVNLFVGKAEDAKGNTEALSVTVQANRIE